MFNAVYSIVFNFCSLSRFVVVNSTHSDDCDCSYTYWSIATGPYLRTMQLNSLSAILLLILPRVAFATLEYVANGQAVRYMNMMKSSSGITKRVNVLALDFAPRFKPQPALSPENQPSRKRQVTCPRGSFECSDSSGGCCKFLLRTL